MSSRCESSCIEYKGTGRWLPVIRADGIPPLALSPNKAC